MTNLTPEHLAEAVKRIAELDAKLDKGSEMVPRKGLELYAAAPQMATIIAQLWAEREQMQGVVEGKSRMIISQKELMEAKNQELEQQRSVMAQAREALRTCSTGMCDQTFDADAVHEALASLNEILNA